jgi:hypothetical protein
MIERTVLIFTRVHNKYYFIIYRVIVNKELNQLQELFTIRIRDITELVKKDFDSEFRIILQRTQ